jgi:fatty-acyl-CoA synthase
VRIRVDASGEVMARGNVVFGGYWQQPDATETALARGWFHTGDGWTPRPAGVRHHLGSEE